jgi:flavin reductase (DIM6/NTAB) family NADH-FMN oxidoreductase RutF/uncharacterized protein YciI
MDKVAFSTDKADWHPSVLPGAVVVVSTVDEHGQPNIAPKSWISMMAFRGPILAFGCNQSHATARNAQATSEFVVNLPPESLVERVWALPRSHGADRIARAGLHLVPARQVSAPLIAECRAHLECTLEKVTRLGEEVVIFGRVVAASIDAGCRELPLADQYLRLRPFFFLENGVYATIDTAKRISAPWPTEQALTVLELFDVPACADLGEHIDHLWSLRDSGQLVMAGPFEDTPGGMVVLAASAEETEEVARADPFVRAGASYRVRRWVRSF